MHFLGDVNESLNVSRTLSKATKMHPFHMSQIMNEIGTVGKSETFFCLIIELGARAKRATCTEWAKSDMTLHLTSMQVIIMVKLQLTLTDFKIRSQNL